MLVETFLLERVGKTNLAGRRLLAKSEVAYEEYMLVVEQLVSDSVEFGQWVRGDRQF